MDTTITINSIKTKPSYNPLIIVYALVSCIVFFIILSIVFFLIKPAMFNVNPSSYENVYAPSYFWGPGVLSDIPSRNVCKLYNFEGVVDTTQKTINGVNHIIPPQPNVDVNTVDSMTPETVTSCIDIDQLALTRAAHYCINLDDLTNSSYTGSGNTDNTNGFSFCINSNGHRIPPEGSETFYTNSISYAYNDGNSSTQTCVSAPCSGIIGNIGVSYRVMDYNTHKPIQPILFTSDNVPGMICIKKDGKGGIGYDICNGIKRDQQFRLIRQPYMNPSLSKINSSKAGTYGNTMTIYDRDTRMCLDYDEVAGFKFTTNCNYNWALYNPMTDSTSNISSVQQIVYIGDLTTTQQQSLFAAKKPSDIFRQLAILKRKSIQLDYYPYKIIMNDFLMYSGNHINRYDLAATQLIFYPLFNEIVFSTTEYTF